MNTEKIVKKQLSKNNKNNNIDYPIAIGMGKGMAVAYGITCIIFIAYGILITYTNVPFENLPIVALVTTAISCVVVGYDWAVYTDKKGLIIGGIAGLIYTLVLFAITFLANNSFSIGFSKIVTLLVAILAGGIGGVFGANIRSKKR